MPIISIIGKAVTPHTLLCCRFSPERNVVYTLGGDGVTRVYKFAEGQPFRSLTDEEITLRPCTGTGIAIPKDSLHRIVSTSYADGYVKIWDVDRSLCLRTIHEDVQILGLVANPKDNKFLSLREDGTLVYYDFETGQKIRSFMNSVTNKMEGHSSRVFTAVFHPVQQSEFISGGWDNSIQFWDMRRPAACRRILGPHVCGEGLDINSTGHLILSSSYSADDPFQLWEYGSGKLYISLDNGKNKLYCGKWVAPMYVVTGSTDPTRFRVVNMYNLSTISQLKSNEAGIFSIDSINLVERKKVKKDEELNCQIVYVSGENLNYIKLEYIHK